MIYLFFERLIFKVAFFTHTHLAHSEMGQFQETVQKLVDGMNSHAKRIESAKLKALGQRNRVESEKEVRKRKTNELQVHAHAVTASDPTDDHLFLLRAHNAPPCRKTLGFVTFFCFCFFDSRSSMRKRPCWNDCSCSTNLSRR